MTNFKDRLESNGKDPFAVLQKVLKPLGASDKICKQYVKWMIKQMIEPNGELFRPGYLGKQFNVPDYLTRDYIKWRNLFRKAIGMTDEECEEDEAIIAEIKAQSKTQTNPNMAQIGQSAYKNRAILAEKYQDYEEKTQVVFENKEVVFKPWIGQKYWVQGTCKNTVFNKRILVIGDSHYCDMTNCRIRDKCGTCNSNWVDSSEDQTFISECKNYAHDFTKNMVGHYHLCNGKLPTYENFEDVLFALTEGQTDRIELWQSIAFCNFVQTSYKKTSRDSFYLSDDYNNSDEIIKTIINKLRPDFIITWDSKTNSTCLTERIVGLYGGTLKNNGQLQPKQGVVNISGKENTKLSGMLYHPSTRAFVKNKQSISDAIKQFYT